MALRPISDSWEDEIVDAWRETANGTISIYLDDGTEGTYDPVTDDTVGGTPDTPLYVSRAARIQHLGDGSESSGSYSWQAESRYRFQIEIFEGDPAIPKGAYVKVENGGRDPHLAGTVHQIVRARNSSHAAVRTIHTVSELGGEG